MRFRIALVLALLLLLALSASAKDTFITVSGSVGVFHSDLRIFNPSTTKDITVQAYYLQNNADNSGVVPKTITVPKRQMLAFDDVVASLFNGGGLGAIRLKSDDDFIATQRIFARVANTSTSTPCSAAVNPCTLGQFVYGADVSDARPKGVMIQLSSSTAFRTNFGMVNPNSTVANVKLTLYDKNNSAIASSAPIVMQPFGVLNPSAVTALFANPPNDLSNAWLAYDSDQPVFAYSSVVDNGSTDQTYIAAVEDTGAVSVTPPASTDKVFDVTLKNYQIIFSPADLSQINPGDTVTLHVHAENIKHGFELVAPNGQILVAPSGAFTVGQTKNFTFTATQQGTYAYFCTQADCDPTGVGHNDMSGTFVVGTPSDNNTGRGY